jgi:hypothetical protein
VTEDDLEPASPAVRGDETTRLRAERERYIKQLIRERDAAEGRIQAALELCDRFERRHGVHVYMRRVRAALSSGVPSNPTSQEVSDE